MKKPSRVISSIVAVAATLVATIGLQALPANAAGCVSGGDGTAMAPIVMCNASDFAVLQSATTSYYKLGADIDITNVPWVSQSIFEGTLDGAGHTVSNLGLVLNSNSQGHGLFYILGSDSVVKDIRFNNANLFIEGIGYEGILAATIAGHLDNVSVNGTIWTDSNNTGGFAGKLLGGTITNSISNVSIHQSNSANSSGGFFGESSVQQGFGPGSITASLFTGTIEGGLQAPISLKQAPDYVHSVVENCDFSVQSYFVATSVANFSGCGVSKTIAELSNASTSTDGFSSWSTDKWVFGQGAGLPQLKTFAAAPTQQLFPSMTPGAATINLGWLAPLGEYITGFDVQTRTRTSYWSDAQKTSVEDGATITGLTNGTAYWVRVRSVNPNGKSDWNYVSTPVIPIDVAATIRNMVTSSKKGVLTVTWAAPATNNGASIIKYQVGLFKSATAAAPYKVVPLTALKAVIKKLKVKSKIWVGVLSQNAAGFSPYSSKVMVTIK